MMIIGVELIDLQGYAEEDNQQHTQWDFQVFLFLELIKIRLSTQGESQFHLSSLWWEEYPIYFLCSEIELIITSLMV